MAAKRFDEIDMMRIIGFLMVVDQHILGGYAKRPEAGFGDSLILHFFYLVGRPAVPMFIAITGFTLFFANYNHFNIRHYYTKRLQTIVMPYLFWSLASIFIFHEYDKLKNLLPILATGTASYHLWYMGMLIRLYLLFPVLLAFTPWVLKRSNTTRNVVFAVFWIFYWMIFKEKEYLANTLSMFFFDSTSIFAKRFVEYDPIFWSIYFVCGAMVFFRYEAFKAFVLRYRKAIAITYVPLMLYMYYTQVSSILPQQYPRINYEHALYVLFMVQTSVIVYIISVKLSHLANRFSSQISRLGMLSFGAYLVHVIVLQHVAPMVWSWLPVNSYLTAGVIIFILTSVSSFGICYLIAFLPFSKYIIGIGPNKLTKSKGV